MQTERSLSAMCLQNLPLERNPGDEQEGAMSQHSEVFFNFLIDELNLGPAFPCSGDVRVHGQILKFMAAIGNIEVARGLKY